MSLKQQSFSRFSRHCARLALASLNLAVSAYSQAPDTFNPGADGAVVAAAIQADRKILVGGLFTTLGGQPRDGVGRLNSDGTLDTTFNPGTRKGELVFCLAVQADGKILVGGFLDALVRLNANGSRDATFNPRAGGSVYCLAVQADGKILVGGGFVGLIRLNINGSSDSSFNPGASGNVYCLALQADGRVLVGGDFTVLGGQSRNRIGRLNSDGTLDTTFNPGADGPVQCLAVQADGKILVGGDFTVLGGQSRNNIGRLNSDGTLDTNFNSGADGPVQCLAVQADGKILYGGGDGEGTGTPGSACFIVRLNADGTLDTGFNLRVGGTPSGGGSVFSLGVQADGRVLVGGDFGSLGGQYRPWLGRLNNTELAVQSLSYEGSTVTWLRGGTSPEVWRASFHLCTNGTDWAELGAGERIPGGWQLTGLGLPANSMLRARGFTTGGWNNGSSWFVETLSGPLGIAGHPISRTNAAGTTATFEVFAVGSGPVRYQWFKAGIALVDGGNVSAAATATLSLTNVLKADEGGYTVGVSDAFGSVTSRVATLTVIDPVITIQPDSGSITPGGSATFRVTAVGTMPLAYQWYKDGALLARASASSLTVTNAQDTDAGRYTVVISNRYGSVTSALALLTMNVVTADSFHPELGAFPSDPSITSVAVQADGKILAVGNFTTLAGQTRNSIGRLNADGSLDATFDSGTGGKYPGVRSVIVQADGRILVGGSFTTLAGQPCSYLGRLEADGRMDASFTPGVGGAEYVGVYSLALQADGKILVGGNFTGLAGQQHYYLGRLNANGSADATFNPRTDKPVHCLAIQADGRILVGGNFTTLAGQPRKCIARLNPDGALDTSFNPGAQGLYDSCVYAIAVQADGKILVGGRFLKLGEQPRECIGRLNADGSVDTNFNPGADFYVYSLGLQADGKIVVGGNFRILGGQTRYYLGRLDADGIPDSKFNPGAGGVIPSGGVCCVALQTDGKILVGGSFTSLAGQARNGLGRLNNTEPASQSLICDGSSITWLRGGTSPEVWRTTFELSTDGTTWSAPRQGLRVPGGWQLSGLAVPPNGTIRARGYVTGGYGNGSTWFMETNIVTGPAFVLSQPVSQTNDVDTGVTFAVVAGGTPTLTYQWRKEGVNIASATRSSLTLTNVQESAQGSYCVVVSNAFGSVTSSTAFLVVNQPPVADAGATQPTVISANGANGRAILNGTCSSDPDGDLLRSTWYEAGNTIPLAYGFVAPVELPVGGHSLALVVNDGRLEATNAFTLEVLTSAQVVERLIAQVNSTWLHARPLVATLSAALASIERGNPISAINQLLAIQSKVRAQVGPQDPAQAATFIKAAQEIIEALRAGASQPGDRPHGRFTSVSHMSNGGAKVQFAAPTGPIYLVEASTDLVTWQTIGLAEDQGGGTFAFADAYAAKFPCRYYRIQQLTGQ